MNKAKILTVVAVTFGAGFLVSPVSAIAQDNCAPTQPKPKVVIDYDSLEYSNHMGAGSPPEHRYRAACVAPNTTFEIKLQDKSPGDVLVTAGSVRAEQVADGPDNVTVTGNNLNETDRLAVTVEVDGDLPADPVKYVIIVDGVGELDPKVRIVGSEMTLMTNELQAINGAVEEVFGFRNVFELAEHTRMLIHSLEKESEN